MLSDTDNFWLQCAVMGSSSAFEKNQMLNTAIHSELLTILATLLGVS